MVDSADQIIVSGNAMADDSTDHAQVLVRPPLLWFLTFAIGWALNYALPLRFVPADWPRVWIGVGIFVLGFLLAIWAFRQFRDFRRDVSTHDRTTFITDSGPFGFSRNPIYLGMLLGLIGGAIAVDSAWVLIGLVVWYPLIRWGVIAREEAYLERKFGDEYLAYKARVRRWI